MLVMEKIAQTHTKKPTPKDAKANFFC